MDTTLVSVTLLSMGMAAALSVIVWRMLRDERQRSEARVTALAGMTARPSDSVADLPIRAAAPVAMSAMFEDRRQPSPWSNRFAVMGALGLVLASLILFALDIASASAARTDA